MEHGAARSRSENQHQGKGIDGSGGVPLCDTRHATPGTRHPARDTLDLVVREFSVGDERDYVDALWEPPHETGWAFQACCVRSGVERFNELEYHAPAAATAKGENVSRDTSRVWAFRGPSDAVRQAAVALLGPCG